MENQNQSPEQEDNRRSSNPSTGYNPSQPQDGQNEWRTAENSGTENPNQWRDADRTGQRQQQQDDADYQENSGYSNDQDSNRQNNPAYGRPAQYGTDDVTTDSEEEEMTNQYEREDEDERTEDEDQNYTSRPDTYSNQDDNSLGFNPQSERGQGGYGDHTDRL